jgi:H+/Cl- antiporter ClcA
MDKEGMKQQLSDKGKNMLKTGSRLYGTLLKWTLLSAIIGLVIGLIASGFAYAISYATAFREANRWVILGLPIGGLIIVQLYETMGQANNTGTNMVLVAVREKDGVMPGRIAPLILVSTVVTHFFGGSSGREGAALQFGASLGDWFGRKIRLNDSDRNIVMLAGMSAAFAALFGTPMAAGIFPMEVVSVGVMYYAALVPCMFSAFIAERVSVFCGVRTFTIPYLVDTVPDFYSTAALKIVLLAICFALAGTLFCLMLHGSNDFFKRHFHNAYLRITVGGVAVIVLWGLMGTDDYLGLGGSVIESCFDTPAGFQMFLLKMIFTCLTLCSGYKGGEIVPSLFVGATLGSALSTVVGLPADICAACGMAGVFCSVTNSPITSMLIAFELFGFAGMPYYCIVVAVCYLLSGYHSLYQEQKIMYSKTENKYINRHL